MRGRVLDALQDLEYQPNIDKAGDVAFTAQQQKFFVRSMTGGQVDIMRTFGQWAISSEVPEDITVRLNACNDVSLGMNLVKAGIAGGNLVVSVEQIIAKRENPKAKLQIATGLVLQAVQLWHKNVIAKTREVAEGEDAPAPWLSDAAHRPTAVTAEEPKEDGE
ncbi:hypothetical protein [Ornithinimicrobium sp. INDO-MA30-4]|uniref:hypothetical protein n=1 Tax=Ornithinimicrobium sp. INDO-MA30-4 TaxID=2908651 RepID=UPI001F45639E|nr:hypothetical protein [Ornithinimicrobium sp. INDO-MA30-4]UJH70657.1 hypothetical protein L0A91_00710 [Ornithinimicrobium sp. INDO-MA30-4]